MRIHVTTEPRRAKPRVGDTKVVKGVTYVRQLAYVHDRYELCTPRCQQTP